MAKDYRTEPDLLADIEKSKAFMVEHFKLHYPPVSNDTETPATAPTVPAGNGSPQKINFLSRYATTGSFSNDWNELDEYFRITVQPVDFEQDPVEWWHARRHQFPCLYRMARDILCIPGI